MSNQKQQALSPAARAVLSELRNWTNSLPRNSSVVREDHNPSYGGLLFGMRPGHPNAVHVTVGLGTSDDVDIFWGDDYRWEGWRATSREVLDVCEAIKEGDVIEETWSVGRFVVEKALLHSPSGAACWGRVLSDPKMAQEVG